MTESIYFSLSVAQIQRLGKIMNRVLSRYEISEIAKSHLIELIEGKKELDVNETHKQLRNEKLKIEILIKEQELEIIKVIKLSKINIKKGVTLLETLKASEKTYFDETENYKVSHLTGKFYFECKQEECTTIIIVFDSKNGLDQIESHLKNVHGVGLYKGEMTQ